MTHKGEVYKCLICGNIVEVLHAGSGGLVCCGEPMKLLIADADDKADKEKHVPIVKNKKVKVGSKKHPMEDSHHIEWISAESETGESARIYLVPGTKPEAKFSFKVKRAYAYCNIHGLWKSAIV